MIATSSRHGAVESTGIVKTGMMERTERQVVTILEHGTLDGAHATASVGNGKLLCRGSHKTATLGHDLGWHLVGHVGSKGTGTLAVAEHVHTRKPTRRHSASDSSNSSSVSPGNRR